MLLTSAASFDRYYLPASAMSETIGFTCLNTSFFETHDFKTKGTTPYTPNSKFALFGIGSQHTTLQNAKASDLILLGDPTEFSKGDPIGNNTNWDTHITTYFQTRQKWGNPFNPYWFGSNIDDGLVGIMAIEEGKTVLETFKNKTNSTKQNTPAIHIITKPTKPFTIQCRYNPQPDMGHNAVFITKNK